MKDDSVFKESIQAMAETHDQERQFIAQQINLLWRYLADLTQAHNQKKQLRFPPPYLHAHQRTL